MNTALLSNVSVSNLLQHDGCTWFLWALVFLMAMFGLWWWLKRMRHGYLPRGEVSIDYCKALGVRERLVVVRWRQKKILLAITPSRIEKIDACILTDEELSFEQVQKKVSLKKL